MTTAEELAMEMTNDEAAKIIGKTFISGMRGGKTRIAAAMLKACTALAKQSTGTWEHILAPGIDESGRPYFNRCRCSKCKQVYKRADVEGLRMRHCPECGQEKRPDLTCKLETEVDE